MKETDNGNAIRVYEIMKEKNYTPEEIEAFLVFLDQSITHPLETMFFTGFGILAFLILACPGILQKMISRYFPGKLGD
ncbi:MAG: hypothetical protein OXD44_03525 [Gammaproteobacteria bacterium]|nr:hypothetical protein [Gammaproteobacteria bacterium]